MSKENNPYTPKVNDFVVVVENGLPIKRQITKLISVSQRTPEAGISETQLVYLDGSENPCVKFYKDKESLISEFEKMI